MRKMHDWYMQASKVGVDVITCKIPLEMFNDQGEYNILGYIF